MSDDKNKKIPQDASRINVNEPYEVTYWCRALGVTEAELRAAVKKVGTSVDTVRKHLKK